MAETSFIKATSLLPSVVAYRKMEELCPKWVNTPLMVWFMDHCELRCEALWRHNDQFRKFLKSQQSRERLYQYIAHWLKAFMQDPIDYRTHRQHHSLRALIK
jgi:hypothetical protein